MADKKRMFDPEIMAMMPMRWVLGDMPVQYPDGRHNLIQKQLKLDPKMEKTVKRLITYLKDEHI